MIWIHLLLRNIYDIWWFRNIPIKIIVTIYCKINYSSNVTADIYDPLTLQNVNDNIADMIIYDKRTSTKDDVKPTVMNGQRIENESINGNNEWQPCLQRQIGRDMKPARRYPAIPWDLSCKTLRTKSRYSRQWVTQAFSKFFIWFFYPERKRKLAEIEKNSTETIRESYWFVRNK